MLLFSLFQLTFCDVESQSWLSWRQWMLLLVMFTQSAPHYFFLCSLGFTAFGFYKRINNADI